MKYKPKGEKERNIKMEQIKLMFEKIETDKEFAEEMQAPIEEGDTEAIIVAAEKNGFNITEADWQEYTKWLESMSDKIDSIIDLSEEALEDVAGGYPNGDGSQSRPWRSTYCWFEGPGGSEFRDGMSRKYCKAWQCKAWLSKLTAPGGKDGYYMCRCWGTDKCVGCWHDDSGCIYKKP